MTTNTENNEPILTDQEVEDRIEYLRNLMLPERFEKLESRLDSRTRHVVMCLENIFHPHNASAVIRSAEAFGLQEIHAVESIAKFTPSQNIVRGTDQWIELNNWESTSELLESLRERNYRIVITSPREGSYTPETFPVDGKPFAIFMGTEKTGISKMLEQQADESIYIPMCGFAESLNISVSAAIILQRLTERMRQDKCSDWRLPEAEKRRLFLKWLRLSIKDADRILANKFGN